MRYDNEQDFDSEDGTATRTVPGQLSTNAHWLFGSVVGGMILVGFSFGIWAGAQQPKVLEVTQKKEKEAEKSSEGRNSNTGVNPNPNPDPTINPPKGKSPEPGPGTITPMPITPVPDPSPTVTKVFPTLHEEFGKSVPKEPIPVANSVTFKDVLPILRSYCFDCHGGSTKKPGDGIDLTTLDKIKKGDKNGGQVLKPGDPKASAIYDSIIDNRMPPDGKKGPNPEELKVLHDWIAGGAKPRRSIRRYRRMPLRCS